MSDEKYGMKTIIKPSLSKNGSLNSAVCGHKSFGDDKRRSDYISHQFFVSDEAITNNDRMLGLAVELIVRCCQETLALETVAMKFPPLSRNTCLRNRDHEMSAVVKKHLP